jgi:hypothetical protein
MLMLKKKVPEYVLAAFDKAVSAEELENDLPDSEKFMTRREFERLINEGFLDEWLEKKLRMEERASRDREGDRGGEGNDPHEDLDADGHKITHDRAPGNRRIVNINRDRVRGGFGKAQTPEEINRKNREHWSKDKK